MNAQGPRGIGATPQRANERRGEGSVTGAYFIREHEYCGELDTGVDADRVWMTCTCGAVISRTLSLPPPLVQVC